VLDQPICELDVGLRLDEDRSFDFENEGWRRIWHDDAIACDRAPFRKARAWVRLAEDNKGMGQLGPIGDAALVQRGRNRFWVEYRQPAARIWVGLGDHGAGYGRSARLFRPRQDDVPTDVLRPLWNERIVARIEVDAIAEFGERFVDLARLAFDE